MFNSLFGKLCRTLLLLCLLSPAAHAELLDASANGFTIRNVVQVPATPARSWVALVDEVDAWWPKDHTWFGEEGRLRIEPAAGGCFCEKRGAQQALHMQVSYVDPGVLLRMLGGLGPLQGMGLHGSLDWKFAKTEAGTEITLWYRVGGYTPDDLSQFAPIVDQVQGKQLNALAQHLGAEKS